MPLCLRRWLALALLAGGLPAVPAAAHDSALEALEKLEPALAAAPNDAGLWRQRAALERLVGDLSRARVDLERACALGLAPELAAREQGLLARAEGRPAAAERHLRRAAELASGDGEIQVEHAETLNELGRFPAAADAWARAIALAHGAGSDLHLARARALAAGGDASLDDALRAVDEGLAKLGPVPALAQEGIALELRAGRTDAALARLDQLSAPERRSQRWRMQRAEILERAGRRQQAAKEYAATIESLEAMPPARRAAPASAALADRASRGLARLRASKDQESR